MGKADSYGPSAGSHLLAVFQLVLSTAFSSDEGKLKSSHHEVDYIWCAGTQWDQTFEPFLLEESYFQFANFPVPCYPPSLFTVIFPWGDWIRLFLGEATNCAQH